MSALITEAFVQEFGANIYMLSQQKGSKLRPFVRNETINGKSKAFDRIGAVDDPQEKTGRHSNTPQVDTEHSRRWCFLKDYHWADLIDDTDKIRVLNEPTSEYVMAAMWSFGRYMDTVILTAADATVTTGEDADGSVAFPNAQRFAANDGTALTNMNVAALIAIRELFGLNDVDEDIQLHLACTQRQISSLLEDDQVTSSDYNTVKALVRGEVNEYMGFKFHRTNRVRTQATALAASVVDGSVGAGAGALLNTRKCVAWAEDGLILGVGADIKSRVSERDDKNYSTQAFASMSIGGVRMEEEKVVIVHCKES
jgi:hypothetical protein